MNRKDKISEWDKGLRELFDMDNVERSLKERTKAEAKRKKEMAKAQKDAPQPYAPVDIYQKRADFAAKMSKKKFPKGSSHAVRAVTEAVINGDGTMLGLAKKKKMAESDIEALRASGARERANMLVNQYMEENFLPAIEVIIERTSPDELLNCKEALKALDKMAIGSGRMDGYTASYVTTAYGELLGQMQGDSDDNVVAEMRRIRMLLDSDQIRTAVGIATKLKKQVDEGQRMASDEDYALLGRMVAYAN